MAENKSFDFTETVREMLHPARVRESLKAAAEQFWLNQDHLLDCIEDMQRSWLARRHEGTRAAGNAATAILSAETPAAAVNEYQQWARGALYRLIADASATQQLLSTAAISAFKPVSSPLTKSVGPVPRAKAVDDAA
jgi:hypothetical protein